MALSTLRPATSPRLSIIRLDFHSSAGRLVETMITGMGDDLRRIAGEVARIECEFGGVVDFTVSRDSGFEALLDTLNVSFRFMGWRDLAVPLIHPHSFLTDPSAPHSLKCGDCHSQPPLLIGRSFCGVGSFSYGRSQLAHLDAGFSISDTSCTCTRGRHWTIHGKLHPIDTEAGLQASRSKHPRELSGSQMAQPCDPLRIPGGVVMFVRLGSARSLTQESLSHQLAGVCDSFGNIAAIPNSLTF